MPGLFKLAVIHISYQAELIFLYVKMCIRDSLETELFHSGIMPAVNPGISVSRVGGNAQIKAMKKVAGTLKLVYSQYRELQSFAQFGSDLDADTKARLAQGARIVEVLKQGRSTPVPVEKQVAILYAVVNGILTQVEVEDIQSYDCLLYTSSIQAQILNLLKSLQKELDPVSYTHLDVYKRQ